ncbi:hypothetical protein VW23_014640 [Devosia insulae DS-56]|uniref:Uncharacterized protein n=1 Tax=Devosia insulae DS-56 TaxID=1116389 RepID=A0A1E5XT47_9HYPH|nr:hypothetical protein [Devosia insulae]OEO31787.1 hypothetical protein VW23_014640 [Devosia insulae DS-56]
MDMLLAATANALARLAPATERRPLTPAAEDSYYAQHTLNVIVPVWVLGLLALLRGSHRTVPGRIRAARHA